MASWDDFLIKTTDIDTGPLLAEWSWLLDRDDYHPVVMTAFGDWFLQDTDGRIYFLDLVAGQVNKVAETGDELNVAAATEIVWSCSRIDWVSLRHSPETTISST